MNEIKQLNTADQSLYSINREHKDCLFRAVFQEKVACVEGITTLLNISYGHNAALMGKCRTLHDYAKFIYYIRKNKAQGVSILQAVDLAIDTCIDEGILKKLLVKCRAEVRYMVLASFLPRTSPMNQKKNSLSSRKSVMPQNNQKLQKAMI